MLKLTRIIAGLLIIISVILTIFLSKYWLILTLFVGLNLFQYGITNWCLMEKILHKVGYRE